MPRSNPEIAALAKRLGLTTSAIRKRRLRGRALDAPRRGSPDPTSTKARAQSMGISAKTLLRREKTGDRPPRPRQAEAEEAAALGMTIAQWHYHRAQLRREAATPKAPDWIGVRIFPPLEPDHPSISEPEEP